MDWLYRDLWMNPLLNQRQLNLAAADFFRGTAAWRIWLPLGLRDVRARYRRSVLGQFWISISTAVFIIGIGILYSMLFKMKIDEYLPFLTVNFIVWTFLSGIITDSTSTFVEASSYLRQDSLPKTVYIMRVLVRNLVGLAHNLVIVPLVFLAFSVPFKPALLLAVPGLLLMIAAAFPVVVISGLMCTRFRDLPQVVQSVLQLAFFATPVMWSADQLGEVGWYFAHMNPFAILLALVAEPIRGIVPDGQMYLSALALIAVLAMIAWPLFVSYRSRVVYWL